MSEENLKEEDEVSKQTPEGEEEPILRQIDGPTKADTVISIEKWGKEPLHYAVKRELSDALMDFLALVLGDRCEDTKVKTPSDSEQRTISTATVTVELFKYPF